MKTRDINKVIFNEDLIWKVKKPIEKEYPIYALDTETINGYAFLIADNKGKWGNIGNFDDVLNFMLNENYRNSINFFYNVKYDTNAVIKYLDDDHKKSLALHDECVYTWNRKNDTLDVKITIIPDKLLKFQIDKNSYKFFDLAQFYDKKSLKNIAYKVGMEKDEIEDIANINLKRYVSDYEYKKLINHRCVSDCDITQKLALKMYNTMNKFINIRNFYSCASLSRQLVLTRLEDFKMPSNSLLDFSMKSFNAGRFEVLQKGGFDNIIERDINSAYPYEIANLLDCNGMIVNDITYDENATHGFYLCDINIPHEINFSPFKFETKSGMMTYPTGDFKDVYMCKTDYETLLEFGFIKKLHKSVQIFNDEPTKPFKYVEELYYYRKEIQKSDKELADTIKRTLNSIYGTFLNINHAKGYVNDEDTKENIQDFIVVNGKVFFTKNEFQAGSMFQPVWGSEITAGTRNKIFKDFYDDNDKIIAIATDGVKLTEDIPKLKESNKLGGYDKSKLESGVIIGSGVYQVGDKTKFRGFDSKLNLIDLLNKNLDKKTINTQMLRVLGLKTCFRTKSMTMYDNEKEEEFECDISFDNINQFITLSKSLNINFDKKRKWDRFFKDCKDVLNNNIQSVPLQF